MSDNFSEVINDKLLSDITAICPKGVSTKVCLASISRWKIGGIADLIIHPETMEQIIALRRYFHERSLPHIVIGMTSNLLFDDNGLRVPCIQIDSRMARIEIEKDTGVVNVEAGAWVPSVAKRIQQAGLTGAEHVCGIPGTIGGLICMNGGSQRKAIGASVIDVTSVDHEGNTITRRAADCKFDYRDSVYQHNNEIIVKASLVFDRAEDPKLVKRSMLSILRDRRRKFPHKLPNCGSVFKSNPAMYKEVGPPGAAIESLGYKGFRVGAAQISSEHANFIVNLGLATSTEVLSLIRIVRRSLLLETGYELEVEARFVSSTGSIEHCA